MKSNAIRLGVFFLFGVFSVKAQEKKNITLEEAIQMAVTQSNGAKLADTKTTTKEFEMQTVKNKQYPDAEISGQYHRLTNADVDFKLGNSAEPLACPCLSSVVKKSAISLASYPILVEYSTPNLSDSLSASLPNLRNNRPNPWEAASANCAS